jgi:hypothetical protein
MKWEEIIEQYKDEWVLIDVKDVNDDFTIREGEVLAHSKDKEEIHKKLLEIRPKKFSIEYTGKIIENFEVLAHTLPFGTYVDGLLGMDFMNRFEVEIKIYTGEVFIR